MARNPDGDGSTKGEFDAVNQNREFRDDLDVTGREIGARRGGSPILDARRKRMDDVTDLIRDIIDPNSGGLFKHLAEVTKMADSGDTAGALKVIDERRASGVLPDLWALTLKESVYSTIGDPEGQLSIIAQIEGVKGEVSRASRADALYRLGRIDEMEKLCETWEGSRQDRDEFYLCRARILRARGEVDLARRHALAMLILEKSDTRARGLLGDVLADAGDMRGAMLQYDAALEADYDETDFHVMKAEALVRLGKPDLAALACRRGLEIRPAHKRLLAMLDEVG